MVSFRMVPVLLLPAGSAAGSGVSLVAAPHVVSAGVSTSSASAVPAVRRPARLRVATVVRRSRFTWMCPLFGCLYKR